MPHFSPIFCYRYIHCSHFINFIIQRDAQISLPIHYCSIVWVIKLKLQEELITFGRQPYLKWWIVCLMHNLFDLIVGFRLMVFVLNNQIHPLHKLRFIIKLDRTNLSIEIDSRSVRVGIRLACIDRIESIHPILIVL